MKGLAGHREKSPSYSGCSGDKSDEIRFTSLQYILWFQSAQCVGVGEEVVGQADTPFEPKTHS